MITAQFHAEPEDAGVRLDQFLAARAATLSRARIQDLIKTGHVTSPDRS